MMTIEKFTLEKMLKEKQSIIKARGAIQISNRGINALQRRAWNLLLRNAYDDLLKQEIFQVKLTVLKQFLSYDSNDLDYLKETLKNLGKTQVEWNILDKDGIPDWGFANLLADARIYEGILYYSFSPILKGKLYNPKYYAKIKWWIQNRLKNSSYAIVLHEIITDYFRQEEGIGETPWFTITEFRNLVGVEEDEYKRFNDLNRWVIKPAVKEINDKSDLWCDIRFDRKNRFIDRIKFLIKRNPKKGNLTDEPDFQIETKRPQKVKIEKNPKKEGQLSIPPHFGEPEKQAILSGNLFGRMQYMGLNSKQVARYLANLSPDFISSCIDLVTEKWKEGKIESETPTGYLVSLLEAEKNKEFQKPLFVIEEEKTKEEKKQKQIAQKRREELVNALEREFHELRNEQSHAARTKLSGKKLEEYKRAYAEENKGMGGFSFQEVFFNAWLNIKLLPDVDQAFREFTTKRGYVVGKIQDQFGSDHWVIRGKVKKA